MCACVCGCVGVCVCVCEGGLQNVETRLYTCRHSSMAIKYGTCKSAYSIENGYVGNSNTKYVLWMVHIFVVISALPHNLQL